MTGLFCTSTFLCLRDPDTDKIGSEPGALERTLQSLSRSPLRSSRHRSYTACEMFYLTMTTNTSPCVSIMAAQYPLLLLRTELTFPTVLDIHPGCLVLGTPLVCFSNGLFPFTELSETDEWTGFCHQNLTTIGDMFLLSFLVHLIGMKLGLIV